MTVSMSAVVRTTATITINGKTSTSVLHLGPRGADGTGSGGGGGPIVAADITDASAAGQAVLTGTPAAGRTALGLGDSATRAVGTTAGTVAAGDDSRLSDARAPTAHTHSATDISDSTTVGRAVLTAADAAAARTAIGAASASGAGISADAGNALTLGTDTKPLLTAPDQAAAEAGTGTTAGAWSVLRVWQAIRKALGGVSVSNTPTTGQVLTATSTSAAAWATPAGGVAGSTTQLQFNDAGSLAGTDGLTWNKTTNTLAFANYSTLSVPLGTISNGAVVLTNASASVLYGIPLGLASSGASANAFLFADAANAFGQRNGINAQTHRWYGTYTDASNYRRVALGMSTAGVGYLRPESAGTGASGNVLHISGLPTSNPGPGILWNDAGTVKVGT